MSEDRIEKIETKLAFQEDLIDELNKTIYQQQQKIELLEATCKALARNISSLAEAMSANKGGHEKPPHY